MLFRGPIKAVEIDGHIYFDVVDSNYGSFNMALKKIKDTFNDACVVIQLGAYREVNDER